MTPKPTKVGKPNFPPPKKYEGWGDLKPPKDWRFYFKWIGLGLIFASLISMGFYR